MHRLADVAVQEWAHSTSHSSRSLRIAVLGRCLPYILDRLPERLAAGRLRRDAIATSVIEGARERRAIVV